jgi:hypothetical protein
LLSLSSSVVFSAFISAQMSYEWDASDEKRKAEPEFYGYLPTSRTARWFALLQLFFLAAFNLLLRSISFVILAQMSTSTVMVVFGRIIYLECHSKHYGFRRRSSKRAFSFSLGAGQGRKSFEIPSLWSYSRPTRAPTRRLSTLFLSYSSKCRPPPRTPPPRPPATTPL